MSGAEGMPHPGWPTWSPFLFSCVQDALLALGSWTPLGVQGTCNSHLPGRPARCPRRRQAATGEAGAPLLPRALHARWAACPARPPLPSALHEAPRDCLGGRGPAETSLCSQEPCLQRLSGRVAAGRPAVTTGQGLRELLRGSLVRAPQGGRRATAFLCKRLDDTGACLRNRSERTILSRSSPAITRLSVRYFLQFLASDLLQRTRAMDPGGASAPCPWSVNNALGTQHRARPASEGLRRRCWGPVATWPGSLAPQGPSGAPAWATVESPARESAASASPVSQ